MHQRTSRARSRGQRGQVMVIFGLVSVLLFVVAGLAIDAGTSYLSSDRAERAAAAAALSGVAYLPGDYPSAQNAALVEAARNGYNNKGSGNACAGSPAPSPCVVTSQPATNQLKVTISVSVQSIFLRLFGFGAHTVVRTATAQYLPPVALGQPGPQQGAEMDSPCDGVPSSGTYCSSPSSGLGSGGNNFYFERTEGWGNPRSEGDPFTPSSNESSTVCGPGGGGGCVASPVDYHAISPEAGTENNDATINWDGGENYLIDVPPGDSADVQIYNPSFAPDSHDQNGGYSFHEDDSSFPNASTTTTDYAAMAYTLFSVPTLSSRLSDVKQSQELFKPFNATGLYGQTNANESYFWFNNSGTQKTVTSYTPLVYHQWISAIQYNPANTNDQKLFTDVYNNLGSGTYLTNSGTVDKYWRLRVDTLNWDGSVPCTQASCTAVSTPSSSFSTAHKGYAVRVVSPGTSACTSCGTVSAMSDMTVYTPVNGGSSGATFGIPLFSLDAAYAGQTININLFDTGDVGGGPAYVGIEMPTTVACSPPNPSCPAVFAPETSMTDLGNSIQAGGSSAVASLGTWPGTSIACAACFQTAASGGGAIYNGQWVQIRMQVPQNFNPANPFTLEYNVSAGASAGDTFGVQVGFNGTPDHLIP